MPGEVSDSGGSPGGPTLQEPAEDDLAEWLQSHPLRRACTGSIHMLDHVVPALQVGRCRCQMQPVTGLPELRHRPGRGWHPLGQRQGVVGLSSTYRLVNGLYRGDPRPEHTGFARAVGPIANCGRAGKHPGVEPLRGPHSDALGFGVVTLPDQRPGEVPQRGCLVQVGPFGEPGGLERPMRGMCRQVGQLQPAGESGREPIGRGEQTSGAGRLVACALMNSADRSAR